MAISYSNFSPSPLASLGRSDAITFEVNDTSDGRIALVVIMAKFSPTGQYEVVHDGAQFAVNYTSSVRNVLSNGFSYEVRRDDGWPASPEIKIAAVDSGGNLVEVTRS